MTTVILRRGENVKEWTLPLTDEECQEIKGLIRDGCTLFEVESKFSPSTEGVRRNYAKARYDSYSDSATLTTPIQTIKVN